MVIINIAREITNHVHIGLIHVVYIIFSEAVIYVYCKGDMTLLQKIIEIHGGKMTMMRGVFGGKTAMLRGFFGGKNETGKVNNDTREH